ncbi:MAG TPA: hypothetical protein PLS02_07880 [Bacteroidales bacterium]|jgi:hypothetical protein|nr:hypothetical protein [Burkholderiales bacterium]HOD57331.1 hypothetical protein [Bacteroidales bacterium]HOZ10790.1 hypothetical protein [Bacteroidales bacterium]HPH80655.1 hypothetical protein [Bacteroidales bacterium]HPL85283.1 hypothetical protein [Bacteroidales bacterium]
MNVINNLMKPYPEAAMDAYRISAEASNPRINRNFPAIKEPEGKEGEAGERNGREGDASGRVEERLF